MLSANTAGPPDVVRAVAPCCLLLLLLLASLLLLLLLLPLLLLLLPPPLPPLLLAVPPQHVARTQEQHSSRPTHEVTRERTHWLWWYAQQPLLSMCRSLVWVRFLSSCCFRIASGLLVYLG